MAWDWLDDGLLNHNLYIWLSALGGDVRKSVIPLLDFPAVWSRSVTYFPVFLGHLIEMFVQLSESSGRENRIERQNLFCKKKKSTRCVLAFNFHCLCVPLFAFFLKHLITPIYKCWESNRTISTKKSLVTQSEIECRCGGHSVTKKSKIILQILLAKPKLWKSLYFYK